ncbi:MAG TPA: hypothetical protein VHX38_02440 [Pseudonocardiaceae bacterium]|jgi:hypothetical protein|nr:hypothetical protein [Pseudonocardiaceae bacterium]
MSANAEWRQAIAPADSAAAIRRRIRAADFAERTARADREPDPRDDEPTDYDR